MSENYIIAIDIGTSSARAVIFDARARHFNTIRYPYDLLVPKNGWSEQDPQSIVQAVVSCLRDAVTQVTKERILCVSFSSQMYSILAIDKGGKAVSNSITWNDRRSAEIAKELKGNPEFLALTIPTGCPIAEIFPIYKILWLKQNFGNVDALKFVSIKDYVILQLTGKLLSDWSISSASGLLNIKDLQWDEELLAYVGIDSKHLPEIASPRHILTSWKKELLVQTGIPDSTPLVLGGGDGPLASLGVGALTPGSAAINVGTSAAFRITIDRPYLDRAGKLWTFVADEELWVTGGITGGGLIYNWFIDSCFQDRQSGLSLSNTYQYLDEISQAITPGAEGLLFIPYISGQQSPDWEVDHKGGFVAIHHGHSGAHFARAVLEGIALSIYRIARTFDEDVLNGLDRIYMTGGLSTSPVWIQITADIFGVEIFAPAHIEGSAHGSMILAALAMGIISNRNEFSIAQSKFQKFTPKSGNHEVYKDVFNRFEQILKTVHYNPGG